MLLYKMVFIFLLLTIISFGNPAIKDLPECKNIIRDYNLDLKLKTYNGWKRVCNNDKLYLYTNRFPEPLDKLIICQCFSESEIDRNIETFRVKE